MNQYFFGLIFQFARKNFLLDDFVIFLAQYLPYLLVLGFLILVFYYDRGWKMRFLVFADGALAIILARGILTEVIRFFYHHARPFEFYNFASLISEAGGSFPSGHAAFFFALAAIVFYYNRKMGIWYLVFAFVNGLARIYAGVHWPLDIVGGAIVGVLSGLFVHWLLKPTLLKLSGAERRQITQ
jgi:undecaprenyl-diphosphatase